MREPSGAEGHRQSLIGVRGRLLLAFFGISTFAVLAATVAMYSFLEFGKTLDQITQRRAMALLDVSRQAERLVAVTPELLAVTSPEEQAQVSERVEDQIRRLDSSLAELKASTFDPAALQEIEANVNWLRLGEHLIAVQSRAS